MILKGIITLIIFVIAPFLLGLLITNFLEKEKNNLLFAVLVGYLVEFAICELISVPMIFMGKSFIFLLKSYVIIIGILMIISIIVNRNNFKEIFFSTIKGFKGLPKILSAVCIILITFQIYMFVVYTHIDDDDAFYVGSITTTLQTNTLYKYSPTTGATSGEHNDLRYRLAPFPLFMAIVSKLINIHPDIVSHVVFPVFILPVIYSVYYLLAKELFNEDIKSAMSFVVLINLLNIFGGYSVRPASAFLLFRIWQGKSVLANLMMPAVLLFILKANKNGYKFLYCILIIILTLASNITTTMAIGLIPIEIVVLFFTLEFCDFKIKKFLINMIKAVICSMPSLIYGLIYFL